MDHNEAAPLLCSPLLSEAALAAFLLSERKKVKRRKTQAERLIYFLLGSSVHAAVIAINEAIDQGVPEGTLAAMQNPNAMLVNLDPRSPQQYHDTLYQAKGKKVANSRKRVRSFRAGNAVQGFQAKEEFWPGAPQS